MPSLLMASLLGIGPLDLVMGRLKTVIARPERPPTETKPPPERNPTGTDPGSERNVLGSSLSARRSTAVADTPSPRPALERCPQLRPTSGHGDPRAGQTGPGPSAGGVQEPGHSSSAPRRWRRRFRVLAAGRFRLREPGLGAILAGAAIVAVPWSYEYRPRPRIARREAPSEGFSPAEDRLRRSAGPAILGRYGPRVG